MSIAAIRSIAPTLVSSLFSISLQWQLAGGNLVFYVLMGLNLLAIDLVSAPSTTHHLKSGQDFQQHLGQSWRLCPSSLTAQITMLQPFAKLVPRRCGLLNFFFDLPFYSTFEGIGKKSRLYQVSRGLRTFPLGVGQRVRFGRRREFK